jgi:glycosyltransferase involved in cell wall biosynthesis
VKLGVVSTRFAGLDGVTLEAAKLADALRDHGHEFVWFAGELGPEFAPGREVPAAHFATGANLELDAAVFGGDGDREWAAVTIAERAARLERELERFVADFGIEVLMVQNAMAIPMQLPLGVALANFVEASGMRTIAHHHDFGWERARFADCVVPEVLDGAFPPMSPNIAHVVINQDARDELRARRGIESVVVPNIMNFADPPPLGNGARYRAAAGLTSSDVVLLQPTRVIPRKGIELTIRLAHELGDPRIRVVVSHPDDRVDTYWDALVRMADELDVDLRMAPAGRGGDALPDAYAAADLVCLPSSYEGFGNALLEAFYYRKPVFVNRYPVYVRDIAPTGAECIEADGKVTERVVAHAAAWLEDPSRSVGATERNYEVGREHFSYRIAQDRLEPLLSE